jgi:hypothetical protein
VGEEEFIKQAKLVKAIAPHSMLTYADIC